MLNKLLRVFISVAGFFVGPTVLLIAQNIYEYVTGENVGLLLHPWVIFVVYVASGVLSGIILLLLSKRIADAIARGIKKGERTLSRAPSSVLLSGAVGLVIGLVIAALISLVIGLIPMAIVSVPLTVSVYIIFGYLGLSMGARRRGDLAGFFQNRKGGRGEGKPTAAVPKILDTSVIVDGRILDICKTGVLEGELLVPEFVLAELQRIADSADAMKRTRGRRGLDVLSQMQKDPGIPLRVTGADYEDIPEVDSKLLKLAKDLDGKVVTNDYNLNKVAAVQDIPVFNINELANAVKPVLMAGEELTVAIVKPGKEQNQGIAYLDDGTMIVVEGAKQRIDEVLDVVVTSILQTNAGRMIFAKSKE